MIDIDNEHLITLREAATIARVSPQTITRWIDTGLLDGIRLCKARRTSREAIKRAMQDDEIPTVPTSSSEAQRRCQEAERILIEQFGF